MYWESQKAVDASEFGECYRDSDQTRDFTITRICLLCAAFVFVFPRALGNMFFFPDIREMTREAVGDFAVFVQTSHEALARPPKERGVRVASGTERRAKSSRANGEARRGAPPRNDAKTVVLAGCFSERRAGELLPRKRVKTLPSIRH